MRFSSAALCGPLRLCGENPPLRHATRGEGLALALCYLGIGFAFAHDLKLGEARPVLVFASSLSYALYLSGSGGMIGRLGAMRFTALALAVSTAATLLHFFAISPLSAFVQPAPVYLLAAALVIAGIVVASRARRA